MGIPQLVILAIAAILIGQLKKGRALALLFISALAIYWLQPSQDFDSLTYWLPTVTLAITVLAWLLTSSPEVRGLKQNWQAGFVLISVAVFADLNRYFKLEQFFTTVTPRPQLVFAFIVLVLVVLFLLSRLKNIPSAVLVIAAISIVVLLLALKLPSAFGMLLEKVSTVRGKEADSSIVVSWLGFSYVAFRLLHTILDRKAGRLQPVTLVEYVNYVIFFPAFTAGPIDRLERFTRDMNNPLVLDQSGWLDAGTRFFVGVFKKFVLADTLAWIALNDAFARDVKFTGWMWVFLYAYSLRIYFDFSGYTDIAIGLGRLLGVRLPENFVAPYLKPNLTQFWNSWHMTLTQWFRSYFFNPLTRAMRSSKRPLSASLIILITQVATMVLIGLWHGVTASFVLWGIWHGVGLFVQNRWSTAMRGKALWGESPFAQTALNYLGVFLTFNFVSLSWLFFALSTPDLAWTALLKLLGIQ